MGPELDELKKKIRLILSQAKPDAGIYQILKPFPDASGVRKLPGPGDVEIVNEQVVLFRTLYAQAPEQLRPEFLRLLLEEVHVVHAYLIAHLVLEMAHLRDLKPLLDDPDTLTFGTRRKVWLAINEKLVMESHRFTEEDLALMEEMCEAELARTPAPDVRQRFRGISGLPSANGEPMPIPPAPNLQHIEAADLRRGLLEVRKALELVRYLRLRKELLEGVNPEINLDKQVLVSRMEELGFRKEILESLQELERKMYGAGKSLDFKSCMDLIRTIYEWIVQDAAQTAGAVKGGSLPSGKPFLTWKQFLVNAGVVSNDEGEVLQKPYNYLSNAGTHELGSEPEQVRVTRNTVIEWGLLVVGRVQAMK